MARRKAELKKRKLEEREELVSRWEGVVNISVYLSSDRRGRSCEAGEWAWLIDLSIYSSIRRLRREAEQKRRNLEEEREELVSRCRDVVNISIYLFIYTQVTAGGGAEEA